MNRKTATPLHYGLGAFELLIALNAFGGAWYGLSGAPGVPAAWLDGTPFRNYVIPALVLLFVVGGSALAAAILAWKGSHAARAAAQISASILLVWICAQVTLIGFVSWLQPAMALAAGFIFLLAALLPRHWHPLAD